MFIGSQMGHTKKIFKKNLNISIRNNKLNLTISTKQTYPNYLNQVSKTNQGLIYVKLLNAF